MLFGNSNISCISIIINIIITIAFIFIRITQNTRLYSSYDYND